MQGDAFKTLFVSRISFDVTEKKLRKEFEEYGPIKRIRLVHDKNTGADHRIPLGRYQSAWSSPAAEHILPDDDEQHKELEG